MNDLILFAGCTLGGAIVGAGIAWSICATQYGAKLLKVRQDLDYYIERAEYWTEHAAYWRMACIAPGNRLGNILAAIPPKKPRENGTVAKIRRILEGEG